MQSMDLTKLTNSSIGLTDKEVLENREKHGMNLLTPPKKASCGNFTSKNSTTPL